MRFFSQIRSVRPTWFAGRTEQGLATSCSCDDQILRIRQDAAHLGKGISASTFLGSSPDSTHLTVPRATGARGSQGHIKTYLKKERKTETARQRDSTQNTVSGHFSDQRLAIQVMLVYARLDWSRTTGDGQSQPREKWHV